MKPYALMLILAASGGLHAQSDGDARAAQADSRTAQADSRTAQADSGNASAAAAADAARVEAQRAEMTARSQEAGARVAEQQARDAERVARDMARDAQRNARIRQAAPTEQEQLAITALEGLMAAPPERALPLLKRVLEGNQTELVKMRALFVLSQIDNDEAQQLLLDLARKPDGALRLEAVRMIGIGGNAGSLAALSGIYKSGDSEVRREVLNAYLIADRKAEVMQLARDATTEDEASAAIHALGAMGALAELRQLGQLGKHSGELVRAYAIAGDLGSLREMANTAKTPELRVEATRNLGMIGTDEAAQALRELYQSSKDADVRSAALEGMMIHGDEKGLLEIYRASNDPEEKQVVLRQLTIIGGDAAMEAIDAALQGKAP